MLSPWCDLTNEIARDQKDPTLSLTKPHLAADCHAGAEDRARPEISPLFADFSADLPPALITSGSRDLLLDDCLRLAQRLRSAGVSADLRVRYGLWHVFEFYDELPEAEQSLCEVAAFLKQRLADVDKG